MIRNRDLVWVAARVAVVAMLVSGCGRPTHPKPIADGLQSNDNRHPAGTLRDGVLALHLEIGKELWRWEATEVAYRVVAFGEEGGPLSTPGPLIRAREGTTVEATIQNRLPVDVWVHGLHERPGADVALRVPAGQRVAVHFAMGAPGTYYYWGTLGAAFDQREGEDSQLTGAFVVDPLAGAPPDRIFVIGYHGATEPPKLAAWVINGRSWPATERLGYRVGETVRWRWINATDHRHPMHLHGTYFRVDSSGTNERDTARPADRALVVTEVMQPGTTLAMSWSPQRPGNWLFHCHNLLHVMPDNRLPLPQWYGEYANLPHDQHMAGLVLGIHAEAAAATPSVASTLAPHRLKLRVAVRPGTHYQVPGLSGPGLGYALDDGPVSAPGAPIVLERNRPAEITIANALTRATTVHWHGIELDSYYDGVPHFGGDERQMTPLIAPGQTFVARFTPPRAGTFIYHTHFNDYAQLSTGLYGALIVLERGRTLDRDHDHVFVISRDGYDDDKDPVLLNGAVHAEHVELRGGDPHRFRLIGITSGAAARVRLLRGDAVVAWRALAKDGAELPASFATMRPAEVSIYPGETYDFEVVPGATGELRLEVELELRANQRADVRLLVH